MSLGFAAEGATVVVASRKLDNCEALVEQIKSAGGSAIPIAVNMGDADSIDSLVEAVGKQCGSVDILVNNAGTNIAFGEMTQLSVEQFDKMYQINLQGPWQLASRLAPSMADAGGGSIINIITVGALKPP